MHILPRILTLVLLLAQPAHSAGDARIRRLAGTWEGSVKVSPSGCVWAVRSVVNVRRNRGSGSFELSGPCDEETKSGTFTAIPAAENCFSMDAVIPGYPKIQLTGCFDRNGVLNFKSVMANGSLRFYSRLRRSLFEASSPLGTAKGRFKKILRGAGKKAAQKGAADDTDAKSQAPEVLVGGY